jgi:hypothetical protein
MRYPGSGKNLSWIQWSERHRIRIRKTGLNTLCYRQGNVYPLDVFKQGPGRTTRRAGGNGRRVWDDIGQQTDRLKRDSKRAGIIKHLDPDKNRNIFGLGRYNYSKLEEPRHWFSSFWHCQKERT